MNAKATAIRLAVLEAAGPEINRMQLKLIERASDPRIGEFRAGVALLAEGLEIARYLDDEGKWLAEEGVPWATVLKDLAKNPKYNERLTAR